MRIILAITGVIFLIIAVVGIERGNRKLYNSISICISVAAFILTIFPPEELFHNISEENSATNHPITTKIVIAFTPSSTYSFTPTVNARSTLAPTSTPTITPTYSPEPTAVPETIPFDNETEAITLYNGDTSKGDGKGDIVI